MPFCPECGKHVAANAKFCRNCGASQVEEMTGPATPGPQPAPAPNNLSPPPPVQAPEYKVPAPPPQPVTAPAPVPGSAVRTCKACGNVIRPGEKYCSKCLVLVQGEEPSSQPQSPTVTHATTVPPVHVAGTYACATCGNPLSDTDKFCGACGGPAVAVRRDPPPVPAAAASPAGRFCGSCGAPLSGTAKFCGGCGAPVGAPFPAGPVTAAAPLPSSTSEPVLGVIPNARRMKMLGAAWDTFTIVITPRRMIFAQLTQERLNAAIADANAKARADGKGFFGIMADQLAVSFGYGRRYETISPDTALSETPGNFALDNQQISAISLTLIKTKNPGIDWHELKMQIEAAGGSSEYIIAEDDRFTSLLTTAYGGKVKMPFGLFAAGPVRIKFF